jgi:hypothetical protein
MSGRAMVHIAGTRFSKQGETSSPESNVTVWAVATAVASNAPPAITALGCLDGMLAKCLLSGLAAAHAATASPNPSYQPETLGTQL